MTQTHPQFLLYLGDTWTLDAALHGVDCTALDLTGASIEWNLRDSSKHVVAALTLGNGIEVTNATGGLIRITVPSALTTTLDEATFNDEIRVTLGESVSTQAVGSIVTTRAGSPTPVINESPCEILAMLLKARLDLLTGGRQIRVKMEGYEVEYSDKSDMPSLEAMIQRYDALCAQAQGLRPRRFAIRAGQMFLRR